MSPDPCVCGHVGTTQEATECHESIPPTPPVCLCVFLLQLTYQQGMAVVLVTALLILVTAVLGLRGRLMQLSPSHLVFAMVVGLGLFLTLVSCRPI